MLRNTTKKQWLTWGLTVVWVGLAMVSISSGADKKEAKKGKKGSAAAKAVPLVELAWPEPPEAPRIKVSDILASDLDLGRKITGKETFRKFLTGQRPEISHIYQPRDLVVSDDGQRVYASDFGLQVVFVFNLDIKKITTMPAERPFGLALDEQENLYVAEQDKKQILVLDRQGTKLRVITHPSIIRPADITIDRVRKRLYVADAAMKSSEEHVVKIFDLEGKYLGKIGNGKGNCKGCLFFPTYVAVDKEGNVYVTSTLNARVDVFDPAGKYLKTIGSRGATFGMFDKPKGVALDSFGNIHVVDSGWSNVQIFNQKGEVLLYYGGRGDYPGLMKNPTGITIDKDNKIYVADFLNYRVTVYQLVNTKAEDSYLVLPDLEGQGKATVAQKEEKGVKTASVGSEK